MIIKQICKECGKPFLIEHWRKAKVCSRACTVASLVTKDKVQHRKIKLAKKREYAKEHYQENKDNIMERSKKWRKTNKGKVSRTRESKNRVFKLYGITVEQYGQMFEKQNGLCKICGEPGISRRLAVDHCHKTGKVRGLLCWKCNMCLGIFEKRYKEFVAYLSDK